MKKTNKTSWDLLAPEEQIKKLNNFILQGHPESNKIREQIERIKEKNVK
jgi:hypothetical protein